MSKITTKLIFGTLLLLLIIPACFAQKTTPAPIIPPGTEDQGVKLYIPHTPQRAASEGQFIGEEFLPSLTQTIIALAGGFAFLFIIIGGIQILTAYGNDEKIGNAKKTITYAIVGLLIAILSYAIVSIISGIRLTPPDVGSKEWQELNEGLDEEEQEERDELKKKVQEKIDAGELSPDTDTAGFTNKQLEDLLN
jgi:hypothetical protein